MSDRLAQSERDLLADLTEDAKGVKLDDERFRAAARGLERRGLARLNKSRTRAFLTPAGEFAARPMTRPGDVIHDC